MTGKIRRAMMVLAALWASSAFAALEIAGVSFASRHPWGGLVDIDVTLQDVTSDVSLTISAKDTASGRTLPVRTLWKEENGARSSSLTVSASGTTRFVWDAAQDVTNLVSSAVSIEVQAVSGTGKYMVVDLAGGCQVSYLSEPPQGGWSDEYKTDKLVLRYVTAPAEKEVVVGSPAGEVGRLENEEQHTVPLANAYYIGVFPVTQRQFSRVSGYEPSWQLGDRLPVDGASFSEVRGDLSSVDDYSFVGLLRGETGMAFDLPTEAQWEYACRAGTTSAYSDGNSLESTDECYEFAPLNLLACYVATCAYDEYGYACKREVGSFSKNGWDLYDMHGNVWEWCRDNVADSGSHPDPVLRGGSFMNWASDCRSASRNTDYNFYVADDTTGFRVVCETLPSGDGGSATCAATGRIDVRPVPFFSSGTESIRCNPAWVGSSACVFASDGTQQGGTITAEATVSWTAGAEGRHVLTLAGADTLSAVCYKVPSGVTVVSEATVATDAAWGATGTYLVSFPVTVASDTTLTIPRGTVVKFADGASLTVEPGGACVAEGVVFTHVNDDTAGAAIVTEAGARPQTGRYTVSGHFVEDADTEYRYLGARRISDDIAADMTLQAGVPYVIEKAVAVLSGVTLTLRPGSIVKFASGAGLSVVGQLVADGTQTQPVIFTSLRDDAHGGDTNGDGARSSPASGDWRGLEVLNAATLVHCRLLYGSDVTDVGILHVTSGSATLDSSEIAHAQFECVRVNGGTMTAQNAVFRDAATAFGYYGGGGVDVVNCVIADCSLASRGPDKHFVNTVFYKCLSFFAQQGSTTSEYCQFFNPEGYGEQSTAAVSEATKCRWGDPLFRDAENGDFSPSSASSPCVDAGNGSVSPVLDMLGNARTNIAAVVEKYGVPKDGVYPDIGPVEYYDIDIGTPVDLAVLSVEAPADAVVGETIDVAYVVTNRGGRAEGSWRDGISLVSEDGSTVVSAGMVRVAPEDGIPSFGSAEFTVSVTVPIVREGRWRVRVTANAAHDLRETTTGDNAGDAANDTAVSMVQSPLDEPVTRNVVYGYPVGLKYRTDGQDRVLDIVAPAGAVIRYGLGFVPSDTAATGTATVGADGTARISLPADSLVYVVISSDLSGTVIVTPRVAELTVTGVNPDVIVRRDVGEALLTIDGLLFGEDATVTLSNVLTGVCMPARAVTHLSSEQLVADFNASPTALPYTGEWVPFVTSGGATAFGTGTVLVTDEAVASELVCTVELPSALREGRAFAVTLKYHLAAGSSSALQAPIITITSPQMIFKTDHAVYTNSVRLVALGNPGSEGELMPGVEYSRTIDAVVLAGAEVSKVVYNVSVLTASTAGADGSLPSGEFLSPAKLQSATGEERERLSALETMLGRTWKEFFDRFSQFVTSQGSYGLATMDYAVMVHDYAQRANNLLKESELVVRERISRVADPESSSTEIGLQPFDWVETDGTNGPAFRARTAGNLAQLLQDPGTAASGKVWVYDGGAWYRLRPSDSTTSSHFHSDRPSVVLCHGALESLHSSWVNETAAALSRVGAWPKGEPLNVLAVDWGRAANADASEEEKGEMMQRASEDPVGFAWMGVVTAGCQQRIAEAEYGFAPALRVPAAAEEACRQLRDAGIGAAQVTLIGAGHGGHVAGAIAGAYAGAGTRVKRLVGLETAAARAFAFVPAAQKYPQTWTKDSAEVTEFYKSTCWLSAGSQVGEGVEQVFGHYNFTVIPAQDRVGGQAFFEGRSLVTDNGGEATCGALGYLINADVNACEGRSNLYLAQTVSHWFADTVEKCGCDPEYGGWCGLGWSWMEKASPPKFGLPYRPYEHDMRTDHTNGFHTVIREQAHAIDLICPVPVE